MKLTILKDILKEGIFFANKITQKTISLPILQTTLFEAKKNFLFIKNTNLETAIFWQGLANVEKEGKICVNTKTFSQLISSLPTKKIEIIQENNNLLLKGEKINLKIPGIDSQEFPLIPEIKTKENPIILEKEPFLSALSSLAKIPVFSSARPEISGVFLSVNKKETKLVATDSFRLSERKIEGNFDKDNVKLILPLSSTKELVSILEKSEKELKIYFDQNQFWIEFNLPEFVESKVVYTSRLIEGEYPKYEEVIPKKFSLKVILSKEETLENLKSANIFSGRNNEVKLKILPKEKSVLVFSRSPEQGEYEGRLEAEIEGRSDLEIYFNCQFLIDGILEIREPKFEFNFTSEEGAAVIKGVETKDYLYVIMPIKNV
jgi:DNA polymerase III subunit beta